MKISSGTKLMLTPLKCIVLVKHFISLFCNMRFDSFIRAIGESLKKICMLFSGRRRGGDAEEITQAIASFYISSKIFCASTAVLDTLVL